MLPSLFYISHYGPVLPFREFLNVNWVHLLRLLYCTNEPINKRLTAAVSSRTQGHQSVCHSPGPETLTGCASVLPTDLMVQLHLGGWLTWHIFQSDIKPAKQEIITSASPKSQAPKTNLSKWKTQLVRLLNPRSVTKLYRPESCVPKCRNSISYQQSEEWKLTFRNNLQLCTMLW